MGRLFWNFLAVFCFLLIITFEFEYSLLPEIYRLVNPFFESLVELVGINLMGFNINFDPVISSDSQGLYVHIFNLIWISLVLTFAFKVILKEKKVNLRPYLLIFLTYYCSLQLLIYGFDKLFKAQFFYPEPNILYTPLKDLSKDILYWSTMGVSRGYSMFLGITEIIVSVLLWFRKTRLIGAILGVGVMINVVAINLGFDISVKLYSSFLLLCFILILCPYSKYLYSVFSFQAEIENPNIPRFNLGKLESKKRIIKLGVIILFIVEGLYPYLKTGNFNDDSFPRPQFHGAYSVSENELGVKRVFIHRQGYLIFQNKEDEFQDFQLEIDTTKRTIRAIDYREEKWDMLNYEFDNNSLTQIKGEINGRELDIALEKIYGK